MFYGFGVCRVGYVVLCVGVRGMDYSHLIVRNELKSEVKPKRTKLC